MIEGALFYFLILIVSIISSIIGAITSGGAIITFSVLVFLGIPTHIIIGSFRLSALGHFSGSFIKYLQSKKIIWELFLPLTIMSIITITFGSYFIISIDEIILNKLIGIGLLIMLPFVFSKKDFGTKHINLSKKQMMVGHFYVFLSKIWTSIFSLGAGFISIFAIVKSYGLTIIETKATNSLPQLLANIVSVIIFVMASLIDYKLGIVLLIGNFIGSYIGSHITIKKGDIWVKDMLIIVMFLFAIKMIFF